MLLKLVSKIVVDRLKLMMMKLIEKYKSSFVSGCLTSDDITIAQETIHSLMKRRGANGIFILKVDLENAYDRVE